MFSGPIEERQSIERHFSRASVAYDAGAEVQREAAEKLSSWFLQPRHAERILDIGCGTGFLTKRLHDRYPSAVIDGVDLSEGMIIKATEQLKSERLKLYARDIFSFSAHSSYDLVASSSAFQWMLPLDELLTHIGRMLKPGGILAFSLMLEGTLGELHQLRAEISEEKSPKHRLLDFDQVSDFLKNCGYSEIRSCYEQKRERYSNSLEFIRTLRALGFTGGGLSRGSQPLSCAETRRLIQMYQDRYSDGEHSVFASYCIGYFEAKK